MYLTGAVIGVGIVYLLWHYLTFNSLINARIATEHSWSNIEVELKRRIDLIDNLVQVVKGYAVYEATTLEETVRARRLSAATGEATLANETQPFVQQTLGKIFGLAESYPELKANNQFLNLQQELTTTENRIAERRLAYNQTVSGYNNRCLSFPQSFIASLHECALKSFFDLPNESEAGAPKVQFS